MIEPTDEMLEAFGAARAALNQEQMHGRPPASEEAKRRAGLAAVLAIVARDRCMEASGHVYHPLARPLPPSTDEHHYDTSCDDRPYCRIPEHHALEDMS